MIKVLKEKFGVRKDGLTASKYIISNGRITLTVTDHGASIISLTCPDKNGKCEDIILGFDTLTEYENPTSFGAFVGRVANRISGARFTLNGKEYPLDNNNHGACLHGGVVRYNQFFYETKLLADGVEFHRVSKDGEQGFPGALDIKLSYTITEDDAFVISYEATTDKDTIINLTNHAFYNLNGEGSGTINEHKIKILSSNYQRCNAFGIPEETASVDNTPYDLRSFKSMKLEGGFDTPYLIDGEGFRLAAVARSEKSGREMSVYTDQKGIQFYSAGTLSSAGKHGGSYGAFTGFCLETQAPVDAVNNGQLESVLLKKGEVYHHSVKYAFAVL